MSHFQQELDESAQKSYPSKYELVIQKLEERQDDSLEHFLEALNDRSFSGPAIATAIEKTTGVKVHKSTVTEWRRSHERISK